MSLKRAAAAAWEGRFCWIWVKISQFFNYNNSGVRPKNFIVYMLKRSCLGLIRNTLCGSRRIRVSETNHHRCLMGSFTEFEWEYHKFSSTKSREWDLKILLFNYWNDLVLGSVDTYFVEVGAYVSLKRAATGVWEGRFCRIEWKYHNFLNIKKREWDLKILLFNYWNGLAIGSVDTYFLEVGTYMSLKQATTGLWESRICWIWVKILQFF